MSLNTTPRTWVPGPANPVTAAQLNTELRDAIAGLQAPWDTYAATWSATTTNPTIGNGAITGKWVRVGKTIDFWVEVLFGTTTTLGTGTYAVTLPATGSTLDWPCGVGLLRTAGSGRRAGVSHLVTTTTARLLMTSDDAPLGSTTRAWATGDRFNITGRYEAA